MIPHWLARRLNAYLGHRTGRLSSRPPRRVYRPRLESLEDRWVPAGTGYPLGIGGGGAEIPYGVAADAAGNVYVTGFFNSVVDFDPGEGITNLTSAGSDDIFVARYNPQGGLDWARRFGGSDSDFGFGVALDSSGNLYVTGFFQDTASFGATSFTSAGLADIFLAKLDPTGALSWVQQFGSTTNDEGLDVAIDSQDNVALTGYFGATVSFGAFSLTSVSANEDGFAAKLDSDGVVLFAERFGGAGNEFGQAVAVDSSDNLLVTGFFQNTADFGAATLTSEGISDIFVTKLGSNGGFQFAQRFGGDGNDIGDDIAVDANDDIWIAGEFQNAVDFGATTLTSAGGYDLFTTKLNSAGAVQFAKRFGGTGDDSRGHLALDGLEAVQLTGSFENTAEFGTLSLTSAGAEDAVLATLDRNGAVQAVQRFGGTGNDAGQNLTLSSGRTIVVGRFEETASFGSATRNSAGATDIFIARVPESSAPTITGMIQSAIGDRETATPFFDAAGSSLSVVDVDLDVLSATITFNPANGALTPETLTGFGGAPGAHTISGSPSAVTMALRNLVFVPTENQVAVSGVVSTTFTVAVNDGHGNPDVTSTAFLVNATSQNDAPTISGGITSTIGDKSTVKPFDDGSANRITLGEFDPGETLLVTVSFNTANGMFTLESLSGFGGSPEARTISGSPSVVTAALRGLVFVPTQNQVAVGSTVNSTFSVTVNDRHSAPDVIATAFVVNTTSQNDVPTITGGITSGIGDKSTVKPFDDSTANRITIGDADPSEMLLVTVSFNTANGAFTLESLGTFAGVAGAHTITGSASAVTTALRALVFVPTQNQVAVGSMVGTTFTVAVNDQHSAPDVTRSAFVVNATSQNDAPTISGTRDSALSDKQTVTPFETVTLGDVDPATTLTLTISFDPAHGVVTNFQAAGFSGGNGVFTSSGTAATLTASLRPLVFDPRNNAAVPGSFLQTRFTLTLTDGQGGTPVSDASTDVVATSPRKPQTGVAMTHLLLRGSTLTVTAAQGLLATMRDASAGTNLSVQLTKQPQVGALALQPDGAFTYTPPPRFLGKATFKVRIIDGHGGLTDPIKIVIKVKKTLP